MQKGNMDEQIEFVEWLNERGEKDGDVVPNPQRYEVREENGKKYYLDKETGAKIEGETVALELLKIKNPAVIRYYEPNIKTEGELEKYIHTRKRKIDEYFTAGSPEFVMKESDRGEDFLGNLYLMSKDKRVKCSFVTIDLRGFTKMGQTMASEDLTRLATVLSREIGALADQFNGYILKYMGDGGVIYFSGPNMLFMVNHSIFYAHSLRRLIQEAINPVFLEHGLPELKFGIAIEAGTVHVTRIGSWHTKLHHDLIGPPINITFKIQTLSKEDDVLLGEAAAKYVNAQWKPRLESVRLPSNWSYIHQQENEKKSPQEIEAEFRQKNTLLGKLQGVLGGGAQKKGGKFQVYRIKYSNSLKQQV